ncbi:MAG: hypothetical protein WAV90_07260 [Gordonia amarae]
MSTPSRHGVAVGMTGTRHPITEAQRIWLGGQILTAAELRHGACVGADEAGHQAAIAAGVPIVVHPPVDERLMVTRDHHGRWLTPKPYLDRNRDIVDAVDRVIGLPDGPPRRGSGTWYTIEYAVCSGKPVLVCFPDGTVMPGDTALRLRAGY